jgi:hypothetical protein
MICSVEDAKSLLRKWEEDESELSCVLWDSSFGETPSVWYVHGRCEIDAVSETLVLAISEEAALRILLSSVLKFDFNTPSDVKSLPVSSSHYGSWLAIDLPNKIRLLIGERKSPQSKDDAVDRQ